MLTYEMYTRELLLVQSNFKKIKYFSLSRSGAKKTLNFIWKIKPYRLGRINSSCNELISNRLYHILLHCAMLNKYIGKYLRQRLSSSCDLRNNSPY